MLGAASTGARRFGRISAESVPKSRRIHDGDAPVVWLDVLDLPLAYHMEASYHVDGERQAIKPGHAEQAYARAGLAPMPVFSRSRKAYPMLRYPWVDTRAALLALADDQLELAAVQLSYINPETGTPAQNILGFYALMLHPGQALRLPARSPAMVFHLIEGRAAVQVGEPAHVRRFSMDQADTCCAPDYMPVVLSNASPSAPAFSLIADETPRHQKLGLFESRG